MESKYELVVAGSQQQKDVELGEASITMRHAESTSRIQARRNNSIQLGRRESDDSLEVRRVNSTSEVSVAVVRRLSSNILTVGNIEAPRKPSVAEIKEKMEKEDESMKYIEHEFSLVRLASFFKTDINVEDPSASRGLTQDQASFMLKEFGPNVLSPPPRVPLWLLFLLQFCNFFMMLLIVAGILCIAAYLVAPSDSTNLYLGLLLFIVVIATCYETFSQEAKSDQLMEKFRAMIPAAASVVRDGAILNIKAQELVVGDLLMLKSGEKVPADCRVIQSNSMKVDQSMITGESEPIEVGVKAAETNPLEAKNIIFNGSLAVDGSCLAIVIRTGDDTLIGSMVELTGDTGKAASTLKKDVEHFVLLITKLALLQALIIFIVAVSRGIDPFTAFIQGFIVIMVANVPQGLPTTITGALYIVAERMGKHNVFVKKLDIIETLGSCSMICTDKTGTLTQNLMSVANLWVHGKKYSAEEALNAYKSSKNQALSEKTLNLRSLRSLLDIVTLNSRVVLERKTETSPVAPVADATELGLYRFCQDAIPNVIDGKPIEEYRSAHPKVYEIPFNSSNKWQLSIHSMPHFTIWGNEEIDNIQKDMDVLLFKGAPDILMGKCSHYMNPTGAIQEIDTEFLATYNKTYEDFGGDGERVLGFALLPLSDTVGNYIKKDPLYLTKMKEGYVNKAEDGIKNLIFVGLVTLMDPARPEVPQAIRDCQSAGIKVVMVTGDHPLTAAAIARKIGLIHNPTRELLAKERGVSVSEIPESEAKAVVVHGSKIPLMTDTDWELLQRKQEIVFARTSPEQKLIIVKKFTEFDNVVAMTGDGVNDSPALKQAAIGVAMGLNGSDVAREAADIVLLDDNFASIVIGVKEGRLLFANLKKSIAYTLAHSAPEVVPVLVWAFIGFPQNMGGILTLCIDLLTELLPATSLIFEGSESDIMKLPPRNPKVDKLVTLQLITYSFVTVGVIILGICYIGAYLTFDFYGLAFSDLAKTHNEYFTTTVDKTYTNSDGIEYSPHEQKHILKVVQGTFYLTIVVCQAIHVFTARTRKESLFARGLLSNKHTIAAVFCALILGCIVVYVPGPQDITLSYNPHSLIMLYLALIAVGAIVGYTEFRKYLVRNYSGNFVVDTFLAW